MVKSSKTTAELNSVVVALDGEPIGILSATPDKYRYSYYSEYEATPDARVLSYNYPLGGGPFDYSFAGALPPYFEHLMPEGWLKEVAESSHLPMSTPLQKLATLCRDNLGAVEIHGPFTSPVPDRAEASARIVVDRQMEVPSASLLTQDAPSAKYPKWWHCVRCHEKLPSLGHNRNFHDHCAESFFGAAQAPALAITNETLVERAASPSGRLAPFYDILPVRMFAKKDPNQLGLTVDGRANRLTIDNFDRMAIRMGLSIALIDDYVEEIAVNLDSFYTTFVLFGVPDDFVEELRQYCDAGLATLRRHLDGRQRNNQLR